MTSAELAAEVANLVALSDRVIEVKRQATDVHTYCETLANNIAAVQTYAAALVDTCGGLLVALEAADPVTVARRLSDVVDLLAQKEAEVPA